MATPPAGANEALGASFRDPSGFVFTHHGELLRQVNQRYREHYDRLMTSGLYKTLTEAGLLVRHEEAPLAWALSAEAYKILRPELVPFISYPYEWSFSQLQDAALTTLRLARLALDHDMVLKDASSYNLQFMRGQPCLLDTLSFESYVDGQPWAAYRQFCQHFLAPLAVMAHTDIRLSTLLRSYVDGLPLDLASRLLPGRTRFSPGLGTHLHLHARLQTRHGSVKPGHPRKARVFSRLAFQGLLASLEATIKRLHWGPGGTEWADYYDEATHYSDDAMAFKQQWLREAVATTAPHTVWDLGANTGLFSHLAAEYASLVIAFDFDPACVERNYLMTRESPESPVLPLVMDLTNPSPALGWAHNERYSLLQRGPADLVIALAVVHHLGISNNTSFAMMASFLKQAGQSLAIEFVPLHDNRAQALIGTGRDATTFDWYTQERFETAFASHFNIQRQDPVPGTERTLYLMSVRS